MVKAELGFVICLRLLHYQNYPKDFAVSSLCLLGVLDYIAKDGSCLGDVSWAPLDSDAVVEARFLDG